MEKETLVKQQPKRSTRCGENAAATDPHASNAAQEDSQVSRNAGEFKSIGDLVSNSQGREFELGPNDDLEVHPAADVFPLLPDDVDKMVTSLQLSGQMDAVVVFEGKLLDGRTRNCARKKLGAPLKCRQITDLGGSDPLEWVVRRNMASGTARHLSDSQRALIGAELCERIYQPQAEKRRQGGVALPSDVKGTANEMAAKAVNVNDNRVRDARAVLRSGSMDLRDAVWNGNVSISMAAKIAKVTDKKTRKRAIEAARKKDHAALRKVLGQQVVTKDALGATIAPEMVEIFLSVAQQKAAIASLQRLKKWLADSLDRPENRVLVKLLKPKAIDELINAIEHSQPWCQCPYCQKVTDGRCQVCQGSGWLTKVEYEDAMAVAMKLFVANTTQHSNDQSTPAKETP